MRLDPKFRLEPAWVHAPALRFHLSKVVGF
jgi:hypothetical protein